MTNGEELFSLICLINYNIITYFGSRSNINTPSLMHITLFSYLGDK